jgi:hypothetical protein
MDTALRWAEATIEWAHGDPTKGNVIVGSPLAVALGIRGLARIWFGLTGWREDLDDAMAFAEDSGEPFTLAMLVSWKYGLGMWNGVFAVDDSAIRTYESSVRTLEASGDDYAVVMVTNLLGCALLFREDSPADRQRGIELLTEVRDIAIERDYLGSELSIMDIYFGREQVRAGDPDGGIEVLRKSVDDMMSRGQLGYYIPATGILVEALLDRGTDSDVAEAEAAITRLAAAPAEGSVIRDVWLLRMRALLAHARGDDAAYRDFKDRYRARATSLGYEGHMAWAKAMP